MFSLWILLTVVSGVNPLKRSGFLERAVDGSICSYNNSDLVRYSKIKTSSKIECAMKCFSLPDCEHSMFRSETQECYLEDEHGLVSCDSDCRRLPCYHYTEVSNVALGALTVCSSFYADTYSCNRAVDGIQESDWKFRIEDIGKWISMDFGRQRILTRGRVRLPDKQNRFILLLFSDGSVQQFLLPFQDSFVWDDIELEPVQTTSVNITILSALSKYHKGWVEIQLFARVRKDPDTCDSSSSLSRSDYTAC